MKAVVATRFGGPEVLEYRDVETPVAGAGEVLVKVVASAVGYGDTLIRSGAYKSGPESHSPRLPMILGFQASGVVEAVGEAVPADWLGRRVVVNAPHTNAEFVACPLMCAVPMVAGVDFACATLIPNFYLTAYHLLNTAVQVTAGQRAVVYAAAGGCGTALVQLGKLAGLEIIAVGSSAEKCAFARRQGADHSVDYSDTSVRDAVMRLTGGAGVDVIFNSILGETAMEDIGALGPYGKLVLYGQAQGLPKGDLFRRFWDAGVQNSTSLVAFSLWTVMKHEPERIVRSLEELLGLLAAGRIAPQVSARLPLTDVARAHQLLESRKVLGSVVIEP